MALFVVVAAGCAAPPSNVSRLVGPTWAWWRSSLPGTLQIQDRSSYTVRFNADGTVNTRADCLNVTGTYTATATGGMSISLASGTLPACPTGSASAVFIEAL